MKKIIRIGTRGSALALYQAKLVQQRIASAFDDIEPVLTIIKTKGDKILDTPLADIGDKGLFTKELEEAMLHDEIDMAVHSLKDLPTLLPDGFVLAGVLERADPRDVLISKYNKKLHELTNEDVIATSSLRRKAQLLHYNPQLRIIDMRGNVDTRLKKLDDNYCTAIILAAAGLLRLNKEAHITEYLSPEVMLPAVCQGIIGIETRADNMEVVSICEAITHVPTLITARAERIFLNTLEGGCHVPIGCYSVVHNETYTLTGFVASLDGQIKIHKTLTGNVKQVNMIARTLAEKLILKGGRELLTK